MSRPRKSRKATIRASIEARAEVVARLHRALHEAFAARRADPGGMERWREAAAAFRARQDLFEDEMRRLARPRALEKDAEVREFAIAFLELDLMFFRSGYMKEDILRRLKAHYLTPDELARVRAVVLDAARRRGQREFRRYCRMARRVADPALVAELEEIAAGADGAARSRARMMLETIGPVEAAPTGEGTGGGAGG